MEQHKGQSRSIPSGCNFAAPYLTLMNKDAPQRRYELREMFNALRWVVERSFGWLNCFRRLTRDYERLPEILAGLHFVVFSVLMLVHFAALNKSA
jgi:hypothetical protein